MAKSCLLALISLKKAITVAPEVFWARNGDKLLDLVIDIYPAPLVCASTEVKIA